MKRILFLAVFFLILVPIGYYFLSDQNKSKPLPVINPIDIQQEMVDPEMLRMGKGHRIGAFRFENQDAKWITNADMKGKVSVVEYFFTTCKSICPIMNTQMQRIQRKFANEQKVRLFSFTVDPATDTVAQMKRYASAHKAKAGQWHFLTGEKADLYALARRSFSAATSISIFSIRRVSPTTATGALASSARLSKPSATICISDSLASALR